MASWFSQATASRARRLAMSLVACALAVCVASPVARATLTYNGGFVWQGTIKEGDPVNLVFFGGQDYSQYGAPYYAECNSNPKGSDCARRHMSDAWRQRGRMLPREFPPGVDCNSTGNSGLVFRRDNGSWTSPAPDQQSISTSQTCKSQAHLRIWDDVPHGHSPQNHVWAAAAIHHENRGAFCTSQPVRTCKHVHRLDWNFETAEHVAVIEYARSTNGEVAECVQENYHTLIGSGPGRFGPQKKYSDGLISRLSWSDARNNCNGA